MDYDRIKIIKDVVEKGKSKNAAAVKLNRSMKTVNRMINAFIEKRECGLIHGNKGRKPANSLDHDEIFALYKDKYFDFNMTHFSELLQEREQIIANEGTIRNIFKERDTLSIRARKRTKRDLKKKLASIKKLTEDQKDQLIQLETNAFTGSAHPPLCQYSCRLLRRKLYEIQQEF